MLNTFIKNKTKSKIQKYIFEIVKFKIKIIKIEEREKF